jgi:hypothetical protein
MHKVVDRPQVIFLNSLFLHKERHLAKTDWLAAYLGVGVYCVISLGEKVH